MARIVSYQALADATGDFAALLGHGGFGTVYFGELNGRAVAVKVLDAARGHVQEFRREVDVLSRCRHDTRTVQIALVDDEAYEGGRLVYATRAGLRVPPRPAGTVTVHTNGVVHGVSRHTAGVRYGLFFLQRPATPRSVTQV